MIIGAINSFYSSLLLNFSCSSFSLMQVPRKIGELTLKEFLGIGPKKDSVSEV